MTATQAISRWLFSLGAVLMLMAPSPTAACNVPVFRYALEQWPADPYVFVVLHEGKLDGQAKALVDHLETKVIREEFLIRAIDVTGELGETEAAIVKAAKSRGYPWIYVMFAKSYPDDPPAFSAPIDASTSAAINQLIASPMRTEVARMILEGESVVWLLLESNDKSKNLATQKRVLKRLHLLSKELELPKLDHTDDKYLTGDGAPDLRLSFKLVTLARDAKGEAGFVKLLTGWDPERSDPKHTMLFAFFGRGRVLGPMVDDAEITNQSLGDACAYLIGACSCQIKNQNPGWDMLMSVDWDGVIKGHFTLAEALPRLTTVGAAFESQAVLDEIAREIGAISAADNPEDRPLPIGSIAMGKAKGNRASVRGGDKPTNAGDSLPGDVQGVGKGAGQGVPVAAGTTTPSAQQTLMRPVLIVLAIIVGAIIVVSLVLARRAK